MAHEIVVAPVELIEHCPSAATLDADVTAFPAIQRNVSPVPGLAVTVALVTAWVVGPKKKTWVSVVKLPRLEDSGALVAVYVSPAESITV